MQKPTTDTIKLYNPYTIFYNVKSVNKDGWATIVCPHSNSSLSKENAGYHIPTQRYVCHGNCHKTIIGIDNILRWLSDDHNIYIAKSDLEEIDETFFTKKEETYSLDNMEKFPLAIDNDYLKSRQVSNDLVKLYDIRYFRNRLYVPTINYKNQLTGYNTRATNRKDYRFYGDKNSCLREDFVLSYDTDKPLYIVEGMFGEFRLVGLGFQACGMLGQQSFKNGLDGLLGRFTTVYGCFDDDIAGHNYAKQLKRVCPLAEILDFKEWDEINEI